MGKKGEAKARKAKLKARQEKEPPELDRAVQDLQATQEAGGENKRRNGGLDFHIKTCKKPRLLPKNYKLPCFAPNNYAITKKKIFPPKELKHKTLVFPFFSQKRIVLHLLERK